MLAENTYSNHGIKLNYYEVKNELQPLVLLHAQGVDSLSFADVIKPLSKQFHVYALDYYGHGRSLHDPAQYNVRDIGSAIARFIEDVIGEKIWLLGHSSGGLIAAYIAAETGWCERLFLEDPPFFSSQGERRKQTFNYIDLSTVCHKYLEQLESGDFVLYYFEHQYAWNFFPEDSREKVKPKLVAMAAKYRRKHPDRNLKVMFWPKAALDAFRGMNHYDPQFGEAFYNDSFHCGIPHEEMLRKVKCKTVFMKAKTERNADGILMAALGEEDVERVSELIQDCTVARFDCGHGIHTDKPREFVQCIVAQKES